MPTNAYSDLPVSPPANPLRLTTGVFGTAFFVAGAMTVAGVGLAGLSALMTLLTLFVAVIVSSFSSRYLRADPARSAFALKLSAMVGATILFVTANNVITLAIGWVGAGAAMAALIGHVRGWDEASLARRRASTHFIVSDLALMCALALLASMAGTLQIDDIIASTTSGDAAATIPAILLVIAAMVRCALPPSARWLTQSMAAPTPVSALMHAGFVNAGGFLLIRFGPVLESSPAAQSVAIAAGVFAALWGSAIMLVRPDVKRSLAGSTVAQMGFMMMSCGFGAYAAACWHLIAHGMFKAWLFLSSGSAIGRSNGDVVERSPAPLALAAIAVTGASLIAFTIGGQTLEPASVPTLMAVATAAAAIPMLGRDPFALLPTAVLVMLYLGGLALTDAMLSRPIGVSPGGPALAALLLTVFLGSWIGQWALIRHGRGLPPRLHALLLKS